jgi:hypothetical protein
MICEIGAGLAEAIVSREFVPVRKFAWPEMPFLIRQDEQDVVGGFSALSRTTGAHYPLPKKRKAKLAPGQD